MGGGGAIGPRGEDSFWEGGDKLCFCRDESEMLVGRPNGHTP